MNSQVFRRLPAAVAVLGAALNAACGGDDGPPDADPGRPPRLEIASTGGDQLGLAPGDTATLTVRYVDADGRPLRGAPVGFMLRPRAGSTAGGATLSTNLVATDALGQASVQLIAGPERVDFQVTADAPNARATFYVSVSARGFAALAVWPDHAGDRPDADVARVELRLYRTDEVTCRRFDPDQPRDPSMAPRMLTGFGTAAEWMGVAAGEPYTLVAWTVHRTSQRAVAHGCVELAAVQVPANRLEVRVAVVDRPLVPPRRTLSSTFELGPLLAAMRARDVDRPWRTLACVAGGGQLLLDEIIKALIEPSVAEALNSRRVLPDADGCRTGSPLDTVVDDGLRGGEFPFRDARIDLARAQARTWTMLSMTSELEPSTAVELSDHRLDTARFGLGADVGLRSSSRPVVARTAVWSIDGSTLHFAAHGFTGHLGSAAHTAFATARLVPAGLDPLHLGTALAAAARDGSDAMGCAAVSRRACVAANQLADCAVEACARAAAALDSALTDWWRFADGDGLDLTLTGQVPAIDADGDLVIDALTGTWAADLLLSGGETVALTGTFTELPSMPEP